MSYSNTDWGTLDLEYRQKKEQVLMKQLAFEWLSDTEVLRSQVHLSIADRVEIADAKYPGMLLTAYALRKEWKRRKIRLKVVR